MCWSIFHSMAGAQQKRQRCSRCKTIGHSAAVCSVAVSRKRVLPTRTTQGLTKPNRPHLCSNCGKPGHRLDTCPFAITSRKRLRLNAADVATPYRKSNPQGNELMRDAAEYDYPMISGLDDKKAYRFLKKQGMFLPRRRVFTCWKCNCKMVPYRGKGPAAVRCSKRECRTLLRCPDIAHTPIWHHQKGGQRPYKMYLRAMYAVGQKSQMDAAKNWMGCGRDSVKNWYAKLKTALAFAELHEGMVSKYGAGTLEFDGTKSVISRKRSQKECASWPLFDMLPSRKWRV